MLTADAEQLLWEIHDTLNRGEQHLPRRAKQTLWRRASRLRQYLNSPTPRQRVVGLKPGRLTKDEEDAVMEFTAIENLNKLLSRRQDG